jgi:hypothetical protein
MFSISIKSNEDLKEDSVKTGNNIAKFIKENLNKESLIIKDTNTFNIISGNINTNKNDLIAEINFSCEFSISQDEILDRDKLDKFIFYIKSCLYNLSTIEDNKYLPIQYRTEKNNNDRSDKSTGTGAKR